MYLGMWSLVRLMAISLQLGAKHTSKSGLVCVFSRTAGMFALFFYKFQPPVVNVL